MQMRHPLALFVYNRPRHTHRAFEALVRCSGLDRCDIVVFCDAPREAGHASLVAEARAVAWSWASRLGAKIVDQPEHLGLARSIVSGVTDLVARYGRVIVLEDDLVPAPDFVEFMLAGLDRYANDDRVAQISGCLLTGKTTAHADGIFLPLTTSWGWATWQRAWSLFRWHDDIDPSELGRSPEFHARFTLDGTSKYKKMLNDSLFGLNDSWAILWWFAVARANKLVLYPRETLIWNGGFDKSGVHCSGRETFTPTPPAHYQSRRLSLPIRLPDHVCIDHDVMEKTREYFRGRSRSARPQNRFVRLGLKVRRRLSMVQAH